MSTVPRRRKNRTKFIVRMWTPISSGNG